MSIYSKTFVDSIYTFTAQQHFQLEQIACLDAIENGPGVYAAQAMLGLFYGCDSYGNLKSMTIENGVGGYSNQVDIYPNPSTGQFTIASNFEHNTVVSVYDFTGKLVHTSNITSGNLQTEMNLDDLVTGIYLVKFISNDRVLGSKRIVINK